MKPLALAKLGSLTTLISSGSTPLGGASRYLPEGPVMFIRSQNVLMNRLDLSDVVYIDSGLHDEMKRTHVRSGDVFINITGASIGRVAAFDRNGDKANVNQHVCIIRPKPEQLDCRYLTTFLCSPRFQENINRLQRGGTRQALTFDMIASFDIPLPSLPEQRRIATILDKADAILRKREEGIRLTEELLRSTFLQMFGDPAINSRKWPTEPLGTLAQLDRGRSRHRPRDEPSLYGGPYPFIQTGDVANSDGYISAFTQTYSEAGLAQSKFWPEGTLCITIAANIAKTAILSIKACFPDSLVGLVAGERLTIEYVRFWFVAMEKVIDAAATQVAQKNINLEILNGLTIAVPPLALQMRFSQFVRHIYGVKKLRSDAVQATTDLFDSLVQRAFRGEL